jgi:hypothetical protein
MLLLSDRIPAEIWAELVLDLLDVKDLAALQVAGGPETTFAAWMNWMAADAAASAAQAAVDAAIAAAKVALETARELATKAAAVDAANPPLALSTTLPARAVYQAKRVLSEEELQWFAIHGVPLKLQSDCITVEWDQRRDLQADAGMLDRSNFPIRMWRKNGQPHRAGGFPAMECANGDRCWYVHGKPHRDDDLPAIECADGSRGWYFRGQLHRDGDLPAVEIANGRREWWRHGTRQRVGTASNITESPPSLWTPHVLL